MTLRTRVDKLEAITSVSQDANGERIETPTSYMFVPFGAEISAERIGKLEADERNRQGKPEGFIFIPYQAEAP